MLFVIETLPPILSISGNVVAVVPSASVTTTRSKSIFAVLLTDPAVILITGLSKDAVVAVNDVSVTITDCSVSEVPRNPQDILDPRSANDRPSNCTLDEIPDG
jgi:hypothetical protein